MKRYLTIAYFGGVVLIPLVLLILPADFFDTGKTVCLSVLLFHKTCPGCGITRAVQHLIHFDWDGAIRYNRMSVVVTPLLFILWVMEVIRLSRITGLLGGTPKHSS